MKTKPLPSALLEIGTEEIPARFIPEALKQLETLLREGLTEKGVPFSSVQIYGTPRRLSAVILGLASRSSDRTDEVQGPPPKAAKDEQGQWTAAALGFAKAQKVAVTALIIKNTNKGERYMALHHIKGQKTEAILKELFPTIIKKLTFQKSMIWETIDFPFVRPIRWIVALYNSNVIRFKLAGVSSDKVTYGLLALGGLKINVSRPDQYKTILQGRCILVDPEDRKQNILSQAESITKKNKSTAVVSDDHLLEVVHLTEYPSSIVGHFPEAYLKLPKEILVSVLKKHQKFFPLENAKGQLVNAFIGVRNGPSEAQEDVREGYERVVNARFSDAQFFYEKDSKVTLAELAPKLSGVGFHPKLGSMWDKTQRVQSLTRQISEILNMDETICANADRAALLSKADLLTQMVGEFPELQGVAGRFYGNLQEKTEVAKAIEQHYWPLTSESKLPVVLEGALVGLADKLDTLAANFSVGIIPSGSADPYGLRRMAAGLARILLDRKWDISIQKMMDISFATLGRPVENKVKEDFYEFFKQRLVTLFTQKDYRIDEIEAVLSNRNECLSMIEEKLKGLKYVRGKTEFDSLSTAIKRAGNLLKQAKASGHLSSGEIPSVEINSLGEHERKLCEAVTGIRPQFESSLQGLDFKTALLLLAELKSPIDTFFKEVMVMVEDPKLRSERLSVLEIVKTLFDRVADFSKLQASGITPPH